MTRNHALVFLLIGLAGLIGCGTGPGTTVGPVAAVGACGKWKFPKARNTACAFRNWLRTPLAKQTSG